MSEIIITQDSIDLSKQFFMNHGSYSEFDHTADHRSIIGCIEPRDQANTVHGEYKTIMQGPGGGAGEALDAAIAYTAVTGQYVSPEAAVKKDKVDRPLTVLGVHYGDCAFMTFMDKITDEMANPGDFTKHSVEKWAHYLNQRDHVVSTLGKVTAAASVQVENFRGHDHNQELIPEFDSMYPDHANVMHVQGPKIARVYVTNLHPNIGKDRNKKPTDPALANKIYGYHDSLAACGSDLLKATRLTNQVRGLRLTAMMLRSAASRTIITQGKWDQFTFLEVKPANTKSGISIAQVAV